MGLNSNRCNNGRYPQSTYQRTFHLISRTHNDAESPIFLPRSTVFADPPDSHYSFSEWQNSRSQFSVSITKALRWGTLFFYRNAEKKLSLSIPYSSENQLKALLRLYEDHEREMCEAFARDLKKSHHETIIYDVNFLRNDVRSLLKNFRSYAKKEHVYVMVISHRRLLEFSTIEIKTFAFFYLYFLC